MRFVPKGVVDKLFTQHNTQGFTYDFSRMILMPDSYAGIFYDVKFVDFGDKLVAQYDLHNRDGSDTRSYERFKASSETDFLSVAGLSYGDNDKIEWIGKYEAIIRKVSQRSEESVFRDGIPF